MNILAIDASTKSSGLALFEDTKLKTYTCITASSTDLIKRIQKVIKELNTFLTENKVDKIILEEVIQDSSKNIKTYKALMYLQAGITFLLHENFPHIEVEYVYPSEWRASCGIRNGRGIKRESLKEEDINFVKQNYGITVNDDVADAIGIGHAYVNKLDNKFDWS
jgi:Holliday junction resolvasome RuvABC endonuclease subunit